MIRIHYCFCTLSFHLSQRLNSVILVRIPGTLEDCLDKLPRIKWHEVPRIIFLLPMISLQNISMSYCTIMWPTAHTFPLLSLKQSKSRKRFVPGNLFFFRMLYWLFPFFFHYFFQLFNPTLRANHRDLFELLNPLLTFLYKFPQNNQAWANWIGKRSVCT